MAAAKNQPALLMKRDRGVISLVSSSDENLSDGAYDAAGLPRVASKEPDSSLRNSASSASLRWTHPFTAEAQRAQSYAEKKH